MQLWFKIFYYLVDLTSVREFTLNFYLILLVETIGLVLIFFSVVYLTFNNLPFVLTVGVIRKISDPNMLYSKLFKTAPLAII